MSVQHVAEAMMRTGRQYQQLDPARKASRIPGNGYIAHRIRYSGALDVPVCVLPRWRTCDVLYEDVKMLIMTLLAGWLEMMPPCA